MSTILGKKIRRVKVTPQKSVLGVDTTQHGIRMDAYIENVLTEEMIDAEISDIDIAAPDIQSDIYDLEPNTTRDIENLPKRTRYYHALIDTKLLDAGEAYKHLRNVIIIMILPYDPFGKDRMVYTVKNQCIEDNTVSYEDGAKKIFLYTKGAQGNPSQELREMLQYIEDSTAENVKNEAIAAVHGIVTRIKSNREVGVNYMKSWEREAMVREEEHTAGLEEGLEEGLERGILVKTISQIRKKFVKGIPAEQCAELLEEDITIAETIYQLLEGNSALSDEEICTKYMGEMK